MMHRMDSIARGSMRIGGRSLALALAGMAAGIQLGAAEAPVPSALQFPPDEREALRLEAKGAQIYECKASAQDATKFEWTFNAPEAALSDAAGKAFGKHYGGPTWESADGGKVVGELKARADAPNADAIPWLLLGAKSNAGSGVLAKVKSIQRLNTMGGKAPTACTAAEVGTALRVPYTATYVFSVGK